FFIFYLLVCLTHFFFFFNHTATPEIYTLSLHDALPIYFPDVQAGAIGYGLPAAGRIDFSQNDGGTKHHGDSGNVAAEQTRAETADRKSTRLNSSHQIISYAVFCLKKKKNTNKTETKK